MTIKAFRNILIKSAVSGFVVGIACSAYLSVSNKYFGGVLLSFSLFTIIQFGLSLYTGKVGYIPEKKPDYIFEVATALIGNFVGTALSAFLLSFTKAWDTIHPNASEIMTGKLSDSCSGSFILGIFCGFLMYLAIENAIVCRNKNYDVSLIFGTVLPVLLFIFCGFNHTVADSFFLCVSSFSVDGFFYLVRIAAGNALGAMIIPLLKKITS